jgi:hypothetical protein
LKVNGTREILVYAADVNVLGGSLHTIEKNTEALVVVSKEIGLEVNADKTKHMVMSRDLNAGRVHHINVDNSSFERVEEFKYLGATLTNLKILFRKNLKTDWRQGMLSFIRCRIFCLPFCFLKM